MIGIILELLISWLILWFIEKKQLSVLGFKPTKSRLINLGIGFLFAASVCSIYHLMSTAFIDNKWILNPQLNAQMLRSGLWFTFKSVLFEELIFRGALLYIAIEKIGIKKGCILSAVLFGIYHWFSYNAFGNPVQMLIIFFMTAIFGLMLAFAFAKTKSLYLPIGLHFGWNLLNIVVFSNGPLGQQILTKANPNRLEGILSLLVFLFQIFALPLLTFLYFKYLSKKQKIALSN
ncbi:CPBP family intramembrane glutamic endopeptidase [Pedobacter montanisoli]|uniref:CPBP family intramembrane metalloprotease n=1 Tax=Pedobacter montanisoli TaxID=2923277 RepID=A0ABT0A009_9SPHI|nr:CPBP family intramembrane glutamic endopeptidase [Pedobacter montanisoli]MCJ0743906.1 CPBP family intramembrane metalloprotease [Pedobacter montanisoli]